jgi:TIR domain/CHAT domain
MPKPKVFVSHISQEAALADVLQKHIKRDFLGLIDVYVSSDGASIEAGEDWLQSVKVALKKAKAVVVLCSKESIGRPWVNFEAGGAWLQGVPIIPVCHTDLRPEDIPLPLKLLQAVDASRPDDLKRLYARLAKIIAAEQPDADYQEIANDIKSCEQDYRKVRREGATLDRVPTPRILCGSSAQYATQCEYDKDLAVVRAAFPDSELVDEGALTVERLQELLTEQQFDIIHLISFVNPATGALVLSEVDTQTLRPVGSADELSAEGFAKLVELSGARLVVLASCDSLRLSAKLSRVTNMVAAYSTVLTDQVVEWERCFYRMLARGHPVSKAFEVSIATSEVAMCLIPKKDAAFAPEPTKAVSREP